MDYSQDDRAYAYRAPGTAASASEPATTPGKATMVPSMVPAGAAARASATTSGAPDAAVPGGPVSPADADSALMVALTHMMAYGRTVKTTAPPPALAAPIDDISRACATTSTPPAGRGELLDRGAAGLAQARTVARASLADHFVHELAVVHQHLTNEQTQHSATGDDPLGAVMETRAAVGRAGGIAQEIHKLVTLANSKRLFAMRKAVDWSAFGQIIAKNAQLVPAGNGELKQAFGALEGASFEMGFQLLDAALTASIAGTTLGEHPQPAPTDPVDQAKVAKAVIDLSVAVLNGCMTMGRAVATASMEVTTGDEQAMWKQVAEDLGKGGKLVGSTFSVLTGACDIVTNAVILINGAEGIKAADAWAGIAGSTASVLAEGTKLLLDTGVIQPTAEGLFAGTGSAEVAANFAAIAGPVAVIIPLAWLATKVILLEVGKLRIGITGAFMAETFQHLIDDAGELARETEVLNAALVGALDPTADQSVVTDAVRGRGDIVRARATTLINRAVNQRAMTLRREASNLAHTTGVLDQHDPLKLAAAARATVTGVMNILDRSPELVAEEAGDPSLADRARQGAPAPLPGALPSDGSRPLP